MQLSVKTKKRVLVTGGRSPAGLTMARIFSEAGYEVFTAENLFLTLAAFSNASSKNFRVPYPTENIKAYRETILNIVSKNKIDLVVPTCEEIFYISSFKSDLIKICDVFCDNLETLTTLHNKWEFNQLVKSIGFSCPVSIIVKNIDELESGIKKFSGPVIIKPIYSRFGTFVKILDNNHKIERSSIEISSESPWLVQEYINGRNLCTYSIFQNGNLKLHGAYSSPFFFGLGTMVYFQPVNNDKAREFIEALGKKLNLNGQYAFDFIQTKNGDVYPLECNPRAPNGGIALFLNQPKPFTRIFEDNTTKLIKPELTLTPMIGSAMLTFLFKKVRAFDQFREWLKSYRNGKSIIFSWKDPLPGILFPLIMMALPIEAYLHGFSIKEMFSTGIRYDGTL